MILRVEVSPGGTPLGISVVNGSGFADLDEAAVAAVRQWRFQPALRGGLPVQGAAEVPVVFRIGD